MVDEDENQLKGYCSKGKPELAVLTNGHQWRIYLSPVRNRKNAELRPFLSLDISSSPTTKVEENFRRFLSYERIRIIRPTLKDALELHRQLVADRVVRNRLRESWNRLLSDGQAMSDVLEFLASREDIQANSDQIQDFLSSNGPLTSEIRDKGKSTKQKNPKPVRLPFKRKPDRR